MGAEAARCSSVAGCRSSAPPSRLYTGENSVPRIERGASSFAWSASGTASSMARTVSGSCPVVAARRSCSVLRRFGGSPAVIQRKKKKERKKEKEKEKESEAIGEAKIYDIAGRVSKSCYFLLINFSLSFFSFLSARCIVRERLTRIGAFALVRSWRGRDHAASIGLFSPSEEKEREKEKVVEEEEE